MFLTISLNKEMIFDFFVCDKSEMLSINVVIGTELFESGKLKKSYTVIPKAVTTFSSVCILKSYFIFSMFCIALTPSPA